MLSVPNPWILPVGIDFFFLLAEDCRAHSFIPSGYLFTCYPIADSYYLFALAPSFSECSMLARLFVKTVTALVPALPFSQLGLLGLLGLLTQTAP